ncbi:MAG: Jag N-terminal domain-containing protein [Thermodesulfobacteriota bacterium]
MSSGKKDFYGKEVTDAIRKACDTLQVPQEELDIEVVETGTTGIFGLIRKKAQIRAMVKALDLESSEEKPKKGDTKKAEKAPARKTKARAKKVEEAANAVSEETEEKESREEVKAAKKEKPAPPARVSEPPSPESMEVVRHELSELLRYMGFPSEVTVELDKNTVRCQVSDDHEEALTGQDGKIVDSLQYILRKLVARKVEEKVRLSIDIGQFREKRKVELIERAKELAALVKEDGKTQAIPPLNPSERRIVHVALQEDKEIRSRSVGGGLFKKVLIYKPGKGKKPGGNRRGGKRKGEKKSQENSES